MADAPILVWLRNDLRLSDNPALHAAAATGRPLLPLHVLDDTTPGAWRPGGACRWWLHHSLDCLAQRLNRRGLPLLLRRGDATVVVADLIEETGAEALYCNSACEPWARRDERRIANLGIEIHRFAGGLLFDPEHVRTSSGTPYRVFTPFWKAALAAPTPGPPLPTPASMVVPARVPVGDALADWSLLPARPDWSGGLRAAWQPGEPHAQDRLAIAVESIVSDYSTFRDRPDRAGTSRLSPYLHMGEISPRQCWHAVLAGIAAAPAAAGGGHEFLRQLLWREFSYHLLVHFPTLPERPFQPKFAAMRYPGTSADLRRWQRGHTGIPIVDAGMRELWQTGWMHNRVRMIAASLLVKNMGVDWRLGAAWFWDTLVDADLANNSASWQWVAGSGADAAPYFRIFNPVLQGRRHDPDGTYVGRWVPELARLPARHIHAPWQAPAPVLAAAGVALGATYPFPCVDLARTRRRALADYRALSGSAPATD